MEHLPGHCQRKTEAKQMLGLARVSQPIFGDCDRLADSTEELKSLGRLARDGTLAQDAAQ
jgi:hypothetical protein